MRHGQSVANSQKIVSGKQETPLSQLGQHQVQIEAQKLTHLGIDLIVCSPLHRALSSAQIVADALQYPHSEIKVMPELSERGLGELEGKSYASDEQDTGNTVYAESVKGVEPIDQFHSRVYAAFREIAETRRHQNILVVCHMNVGRMLQAIVKNQPALAMYDTPRLDNAHAERLI